MGKSSSLPASMSKVRIKVEKLEKEEKFWVGPTASSPGPILFKVAATAEKFVIKSKLSMAMSRTENAKINT